MTKLLLASLTATLLSGPTASICVPSGTQATPASQSCTHGNCCGEEGCWVTCKCWK